MKAVVAVCGIVLIMIGRIFIYRASKAAWLMPGDDSPMHKLMADPQLKSRYRFGQAQYFLGVAVFATCFFL
ncbi:MAG: hypothetical protein K2X64_06640 [Rhodocyclaceae bacterium]|nr:hypothetical protein [Rhodocyclaceae bacterium]